MFKFGNKPKTCSIDGCEKTKFGKGWCSMHYARYKRNGDPLALKQPKIPNRGCKIEGCDNKHKALGFCTKHYEASKRNTPAKYVRNKGKKCGVKNCIKDATHKGMCEPHYRKIRKTGQAT